MLLANWFRQAYAALCCKLNGGFVTLERAGAKPQSFSTWLSLVALTDDTAPRVLAGCSRGWSDGQCARLLNRFPRLTRVWLDGPTVTGDLPWTDFQAKGIESVMFWNTSVCDGALKRLSVALPDLLDLEVFGGQITDVCADDLRLLASLRRLRLSRVRLTDVALPLLCECKRLEHLDLSRTRCSDAGLGCVARLKQLRHLNMSGTSITDKGLVAIQQLPHLESLFIENTAVTDRSLPAIERLSALQALLIGGTLITADAMRPLLQRRPGLEIVHVPLDSAV